jgi:hypothetical protein
MKPSVIPLALRVILDVVANYALKRERDALTKGGVSISPHFSLIMLQRYALNHLLMETETQNVT